MTSSSLVQLAMLLDLQDMFAGYGSSLWGNELFQAASNLAAGTPEFLTLPVRITQITVFAFAMLECWQLQACMGSSVLLLQCSLRATVEIDVIGSGRRGFCAALLCMLNPERHFLDSILWVSKAHGRAQRHRAIPFTDKPLPSATKVKRDMLFE